MITQDRAIELIEDLKEEIESLGLIPTEFQCVFRILEQHSGTKEERIAKYQKHNNRLDALIFEERTREKPCKHLGKKCGTVEKECCGGKKKQVDVFKCSKKGVEITKGECLRCSSYE